MLGSKSPNVAYELLVMETNIHSSRFSAGRVNVVDVVGGQVHAPTNAQRKTSMGTRRFIKERVCARSCVYVCVEFY